MLQHVATSYAIERLVGERQAREICYHITRAVALHTLPRPPKHLMREIETGDLSVRVGMLQHVLGNLAGAASDVQNSIARLANRTSAP